MEKIKKIFPLLRECVIYSVIIFAIDFVAVLILSFYIPLGVTSFLSFMLLVESGIGLTLGGTFDLLSSASMSKILEEISRSKKKEPWTIRKYKIDHLITNKVIVTSGIVFFSGLILSLFF